MRMIHLQLSHRTMPGWLAALLGLLMALGIGVMAALIGVLGVLGVVAGATLYGIGRLLGGRRPSDGTVDRRGNGMDREEASDRRPVDPFHPDAGATGTPAPGSPPIVPMRKDASGTWQSR